MAESQPILSPERMEQVRQYRAIRYRLQLISLAVSAGFLLLMVLGGSRWLWEQVPITVPFVVTFLLLYTLVEFPGDWYGFLQSRRFGLTVQSTAGWLADQAKGFLISLVIMGGGLLLVTAAWRWSPGAWYLWAAAAGLLFSALMTFVSPVLIAPLFNKYEPLQDPDLTDRLLQLSARAGVRVRGVFVSGVSAKQTTLNASLSGLGATRRIVLFDTLVQSCTTEEVEVVLGHEMGHHVYGHIFKIVGLMGGFLAALFLVAGFALEPLSATLGTGGLTPAALPLLMLLYGVIGAVLLPAFMAISRQWERDCDRFALQLTGNPGAFLTFFRKVADRNMADLNPPRWVYYFQYSHPPIPERLAMAERFAASGN